MGLEFYIFGWTYTPVQMFGFGKMLKCFRNKFYVEQGYIYLIKNTLKQSYYEIL